MLAVIADDITGAAEIAGIAHRYGLSCQLSIGMPTSLKAQGTDVIVIATDTRSLPAKEAYDQTADITRQLCALLQGGMAKNLLFRKTDSALRGNVQEELHAIIDNTPYTQAIFMPANPSKGRIIKDGIYYIASNQPQEGVPSPLGESEGASGLHLTPLSETDFRFDPEFPAMTSNVKERFPNLNIPNATCQGDIDKIVTKVVDASTTEKEGENLFLAGAADLFTSLISHLYHTMSAPTQFKGLSVNSSKLIVRGSTQSKAIDLGIPVESMPLDVFYEKSAPCTWAESILARINRQKSIQQNHIKGSLPLREGPACWGRLGMGWGGSILTIGDKEVRPGKHAAVYLRQAMAEVTCTILSAHTPDELIIEGGATAYAILSQTPWRSFLITDEIAPGVVRMQPTEESLHITLKPGSYDWGKLFTQTN